MRKSLAMVTLLLGTLALLPALAQQQDAAGLKDLQTDTPKFHRHGARAIPSHYIVVLDEDVAPEKSDVEPDRFAIERRADDVMRLVGAAPTHVYTDAIRGFSARMTEEEALKLSEDDRVAFVEEDSVMEAIVTQNNPPWGLDRIDQAARPLSGTYAYASTGSGVNAYIIDTGIRVAHTQFGGRASVGFDAIGDGRNGIDCNGHGTHVAGTVGGSTYGVAKSVRLFAVRVLSCTGSGSNSGVIAGVDWVTRNRVRPAVANMSLGGGASTALDNAVRNSIAAGVTYAIAAGNSNRNASTSSPARVAEAITVGASTSTDARSSFSNFGSVVDIFAPGSAILSAWSTSNTATNTISGTSMAAPHVAGVAARHLQTATGASPATVRNALVAAASLNRLSGIPTGTANRLLFRSGAQ
jgi:subtilisin family serine protease